MQVGFYIYISLNGLFIGGGVYCFLVDVLYKIWEGIDYDGQCLKEIIFLVLFIDMFSGLDEDEYQFKIVFRGFLKDYLYIDLLCWKSFIFIVFLIEEQVFVEDFLVFVEWVYVSLCLMCEYFNCVVNFEVQDM